MPTYNQAKYLPMALDSVLNQTWHDFEFIVVNDGSTDQTPDILEDYQKRYGFRVIHKQNEKLPRALNTGFNQACGEYLTWTSSDNIMLPNMLEAMVATLDQEPKVGFVYADWDVIDDDGNFIGTVNTFDYDRHLLMRLNYINACFMYRRACQDKVGLYNPDYLYVEDWEYWWRISQCFEMQRIPQVLYQYRVHGNSLTQTEVVTKKQRKSDGYRKLADDFRGQPVDWYTSKLKWEWLRIKTGQNPELALQPILKG